MSDEEIVATWPQGSVCGLSYCPKHTGGYCIECHTTAWNALQHLKHAEAKSDG